MKTEVKERSSVLQELTVTVEAEQAMQDYRKVLTKMKNFVQIPGFRKGKAPIGMVEQLYGEYAKEEFLNQQIETYYKEALTQIDSKPISEGNPESLDWEKGKDLVAVFTFDVMPEIEIKNYKNLEIPYEEKEYSAELLEEQLKHFQKELATTVEAEQIAWNDDIEFTIFAFDEDGNQVELTNSKTLFIEGEYSPEFYQNLKQAKVGDEIKTILFGLRDSMDEADVKDAIEDFGEDCFGQEFLVKVDAIQRSVLPELNDELAKDMEFDSLEALKENLEQEIKAKLKKENEDILRGAILDKLMKENPFELPESMIRHYAEQMAKPYAKSYNMKVEDLTEIYKGLAEYNMKSYYILKQLKKIEPVEVTEEDKEELIKEAAENLKMDVEKYKELYKKEIESDEFVEPIIEKKIIHIVKENATFVPYPDKQDEQNAEISEQPQK